MSREATHVLVDVAPGSLLLDLASGALLRLNEAATFLWRHHLDGRSFDDIVDAFANRYQIPFARARQDATAALTISPTPEADAADSEFSYQRSGEGYLFSYRRQPVFVVDEYGHWLSPAPGVTLTPLEAAPFLSGIAPKLLSLRSHRVLHSSGVVLADGVIAFSGASGAGKTTTARALVRAGASPSCEDKLLVQIGAGGVEVFVEGEMGINQWAANGAQTIALGKTVSCAELDAVAAGPTRPLRELGFVDSGQRASRFMIARRLSDLEAAGAIFHNSFYGSDVSAEWKRQLESSAALAKHVACYDLTMPDGLPALAETAALVVARCSLKS